MSRHYISLLVVCFVFALTGEAQQSSVHFRSLIKQDEYIQLYSPYHIDEPGYIYSFRGAKSINANTAFPKILYAANTFQTPVYFEGGDSIILSINQKEVIATSPGNPARNADLQLMRTLSLTFGDINTISTGTQVVSSADQYDSILYAAYRLRIEFIQSYIREKPVSTNCYQYITAHFLYQYINLVIAYAHNSHLNVLPKLVHRTIAGNTIASNDSLLHVDAYQQYLFIVSNYMTTWQSGSMNLLEYGVSNFTNESKNFLLYSVYQRKSANDKLFPSLTIDSIYNFVLQHCTNKHLLEEIERIQKSASNTNNKDVLISLGTNKTVQLKSLFAKYKGKYIVVDCWASWCVPCLDEMPDSKELQESLKNKDVVFLYFSLDKNGNNWRRAAENMPEIMTPNNSFLLQQNYNSSFAKAYNITTLPRYLIFNRQGKIINKNAARPSDPALKQLLLKYLQ